MSKLKEPTYEDLRKELSDEEIAESFVFRSTMTAEERNQADLPRLLQYSKKSYF